MHQATIAKLEQSLFTTSRPNENLHRCVVVFDNKHAVTFQHGSHSSLKKDQKLILYNVADPRVEIEVVVTVVSEKNDFVIFEPVNSEFSDYPGGFYSMYPGQGYRQLGVCQKRAGYFLGTSHGEYEDSGSGVFTLDGRFIGISIAKKRFASSSLQISGSIINYEELADHHPETKIISADAIMTYLDIDDPDFPPPEKKHAGEKE